MKSRIGKFLIVRLGAAAKKDRDVQKRKVLADIQNDVITLESLLINSNISRNLKDLYKNKILILKKIIREKEKSKEI